LVVAFWGCGDVDAYVDANVPLKRQKSDLILSASDAVYAVTALLESPHTARRWTSIENDFVRLHQFAVAKESWLNSTTETAKINFWCAYDALGHNVPLLRAGIEEAIHLQITLVQRVIALLNKKEIVQAGPFRYVLLSPSITTTSSSLLLSSSTTTTPTGANFPLVSLLSMSHSHHSYFVHPLTLARLGHFLVDTLLVRFGPSFLLLLF
jgi:hypothetical protein